MLLMKRYTYVLLLLTLSLIACTRAWEPSSEAANSGLENEIELQVVVPQQSESRAVTFAAREHNLGFDLRISAQGAVSAYALQAERWYRARVQIKSVSDDGKRATLGISFPQSNRPKLDQAMTLVGFTGDKTNYASYGAMTANRYRAYSIDKFSPPLSFLIEDFSFAQGQRFREAALRLKHIGAYEVLHITNKSNQAVNADEFMLVDALKPTSLASWAYIEMPYKQWFFVPKYNLLEGRVVAQELYTQFPELEHTTPTIQPNKQATIYSWYIPKEEMLLPPLMLAYMRRDRQVNYYSDAVLASKGLPMKAGYAYHAWGEWNGKDLKLLTRQGEEQPVPSLRVKTVKGIGESFTFTYLLPEDHIESTYVDLNNNGSKDRGEGFDNLQGTRTVQLVGSDISFRGHFTALSLARERLIVVEPSAAFIPRYLDLRHCGLDESALNHLLSRLPQLNGAASNTSYIALSSNSGEKTCDITRATSKRWVHDLLRFSKEGEQSFVEFGTSPRFTATDFELPVNTINLYCKPKQADGSMWIDLNGDAVMQAEEDIRKLQGKSNTPIRLSTAISTLRIYGEIEQLELSDASKNLRKVDCNSSPSLRHLELKKLGWEVRLEIEKLKGLVHLVCVGNYRPIRGLRSFDLSELEALSFLKVNGCSLNSITLDGLSELRYVDLGNNQLYNLELQSQQKLEHLYLNDTALSHISNLRSPYLRRLDLTACKRLSKEALSRIVEALPDRRQQAQQGVLWLNAVPNTTTLDISSIKSKNWRIDIESRKQDNGAKLKDLKGEDW